MLHILAQQFTSQFTVHGPNPLVHLFGGVTGVGGTPPSATITTATSVAAFLIKEFYMLEILLFFYILTNTKIELLKLRKKKSPETKMRTITIAKVVVGIAISYK